MKTEKEILQELVNFVENRYEESSHTYLDTYRASRQNSLKFQQYIKKLAEENNIDLKFKELKCIHDDVGKYY